MTEVLILPLQLLSLNLVVIKEQVVEQSTHQDLAGVEPTLQVQLNIIIYCLLSWLVVNV